MNHFLKKILILFFRKKERENDPMWWKIINMLLKTYVENWSLYVIIVTINIRRCYSNNIRLCKCWAWEWRQIKYKDFFTYYVSYFFLNFF